MLVFQTAMRALAEFLRTGYGQLQLVLMLTVLAAVLAVILPLAIERVLSRGQRR